MAKKTEVKKTKISEETLAEKVEIAPPEEQPSEKIESSPENNDLLSHPKFDKFKKEKGSI